MLSFVVSIPFLIFTLTFALCVTGPNNHFRPSVDDADKWLLVQSNSFTNRLNCSLDCGERWIVTSTTLICSKVASGLMLHELCDAVGTYRGTRS